MPTVLRWAGYRAYFVGHDGHEPPHVHVDRGGCSAKIWLQPVAIARNIGYARHELADILRTVRSNSPEILKLWNEHCRGTSPSGPRR
jgi:hypothetical protein